MSLEYVDKTLPVDLTIDELEVKTQELTTAMVMLNELESEKKRSQKGYTKQIEDAEAVVNELHSIVHQRKQNLPVKCYYRFEYERGLVETVRTDTGEIVETRAMTAAERQQKLEFETVN